MIMFIELFITKELCYTEGIHTNTTIARGKWRKSILAEKIAIIVNIAYNISLAITIFRKSQRLCYIKGRPVYRNICLCVLLSPTNKIWFQMNSTKVDSIR